MWLCNLPPVKSERAIPQAADIHIRVLSACFLRKLLCLLFSSAHGGFHSSSVTRRRVLKFAFNVRSEKEKRERCTHGDFFSVPLAVQCVETHA